MGILWGLVVFKKFEYGNPANSNTIQEQFMISDVTAAVRITG